MMEYIASVQAARADLFRLLGDEDRLRLLALCAEEELTVGELATLLGESQPQVTKKSQPLREAKLLATRRDGTRTLLRRSIVANATAMRSTASAGTGHRGAHEVGDAARSHPVVVFAVLEHRAEGGVDPS